MTSVAMVREYFYTVMINMASLFPNGQVMNINKYYVNILEKRDLVAQKFVLRYK